MINKNDIPWYEAPLPFVVHRCKTWSWGFIGDDHTDTFYRCACGAGSFDENIWLQKNQRRKG